MPARKNETVSAGPIGLGRIVFHRVVEKLVGNRGQCHGGAWVSAVGSLDRIHAKGADGVDCKFFNVGRCYAHQRVHSRGERR